MAILYLVPYRATIGAEWVFTDEIVKGAVYAYNIQVIEDTITVIPDPVTELEHFKEFVTGLPDDVFDKPQLSEQRKRALCNKIDEVIEKVKVGNYTNAVNKLLYDIRAKMDGDSTAEDWITDQITQFKLCIIIDHIILSIELLKKECG